MSQAPRRTRLSPDDRRRQLVGIGLAKLVSTPIQDLSVDEVAAEAGISRGLLFHYFPTKRDFYLACLGAAGRRILRTTAPDPALPPEQRLHQMIRLLVEQIDRRRTSTSRCCTASAPPTPRWWRSTTRCGRRPPTG